MSKIQTSEIQTSEIQTSEIQTFTVLFKMYKCQINIINSHFDNLLNFIIFKTQFKDHSLQQS